MARDFYDEKTGKLNNMTPRQIRVARDFMKDGDMTAAVKRHHDISSRYALNTQVHRYRQNPNVIGYIIRNLAEQGHVEMALKVHLDAMKATDKDGRPDHNIRLKAGAKVLDITTAAMQKVDKLREEDRQELLDALRLFDEEDRQYIIEHGSLPPAEETE